MAGPVFLAFCGGKNRSGPPKCELLDNALKGRHRFWIRGIALGFIIIFIVAGLTLKFKPEYLKKSSPAAVQIKPPCP
jgi:hypothetical protein